jgi:iron-sulfur cluster assembly accessory protein
VRLYWGRFLLKSGIAVALFNFLISESAAQKIKTFDAIYLRIDITGGGCSGFQYLFDLTDDKNANDMVIEKDEAQVLIDPTFQDMLNGCTLDFETNLSGSRFKITNPNATNSCGCGNSFAV